MQARGGYYFKLSSGYLFTTEEFNHEGDRLDIFQERIIYENTSFRDFSLSAYLEYGLFERLTVVAQLPFKILTSKRTEILGDQLLARIVTLHTVGVADLSLSGRYGLFHGGFALSLQGGVKMPMGYEAKPSNDGPPLGTGKLDVKGHLLVGQSLHPWPLYVSGSAGYRHRTGPLHDQWLFAFEVGLTSGELLIKLAFEGVKSTVAPPDIVGQPVMTPLPGGGGALPNIIVGDQDIYKASPSITYSLGRGLAMQAEIWHIFAGKNTVAGSTYTFGLILSR